jgi:ankyrin repeat protein
MASQFCILLFGAAVAYVLVSKLLGDRPLRRAARDGDLETAILLLLIGADPNVQDILGDTPLHLAVKKYNLGIVKVLLEHGADPNVQDICGWTPLHTADGNLEMIKVLLGHGADPNIKNNKGETPLHQAAFFRGQGELVKVLLEHGADPNIKNLRSGKTFHSCAIDFGWVEIFKDLLDRNYDHQPFLGSLYQSLQKYPKKEKEILACLEIIKKRLAKRIYSKLKVLLQAKMGLRCYYEIIDNLFPERPKLITDRQLFEIISLAETIKPSERYYGELRDSEPRYLSEDGKLILKKGK